MPLGLTVLDKEGAHIHANRAAQEMLGFSFEELRESGPTPHPYWPSEEIQNINEAFETMTEGNFSEIELVFSRKNGERFPVLIHPAVIEDLDGEMAYFATILDLSNQKNLEAQLHRSQKMEAIGRVAGGVAHDFNNLLTAILGTAELALSNELEDCVREDLETILNLVVNAREATPDGGTLELSTRYLPETKVVTLWVKDSGRGLDPRVSENIFEPFYTTKPGGSGLGLSTCFAVITSLGGSITVESEPGCGATFEILLPVSETAASVTEQKPLEGMSSYKGRESVLVVEDEATILKLVKRSLERLGYKVQAFPSAEEALDLADDDWSQIDLLLTDVLLPGKKGTELAEIVMSRYPELRVVFMSGYVGGVEFPIRKSELKLLSKPFTNRELLEFVRGALDEPGT